MKRKDQAFKQIVVGFFMVALTLLLAYFTIVVSGVDLMTGRSRIRIKAVFSGVGGLKDHDSVMYRGTKVGTVERVSVTPSNLVVSAVVDGGIVLRRGCSASVCHLSMLGGNYLQLEEGEGDVIELDGAVIAGETPTDWMRDIARIAHNLDELTSSPEIRTMITNFNAVGERAVAIADKVAGFADRIDVFAAKADDISDKISNIVARVERGEGTMGKILSSDDTVYSDLKIAMENAREITTRLNRQKMFDDLESAVAALRKSAENFNSQEVLSKANALLDNLNVVACDLREGNGTIGRLAKDPTLYTEVEGLIRDVRQVIDNYRDTTPISTFSSLAVGAF